MDSKTDMTMSVYTYIVLGDESYAIKALPILQAKTEIAEILATGTDNGKSGVQKSVHTGVLARDKLSIVGNRQQNPHQVVLGHKALKTKTLGNKKTSLSAIYNKVLAMGGIVY